MKFVPCIPRGCHTIVEKEENGRGERRRLLRRKSLYLCMQGQLHEQFIVMPNHIHRPSLFENPIQETYTIPSLSRSTGMPAATPPMPPLPPPPGRRFNGVESSLPCSMAVALPLLLLPSIMVPLLFVCVVLCRAVRQSAVTS